jgi:tRNA pseudouridine(55) synthase
MPEIPRYVLLEKSSWSKLHSECLELWRKDNPEFKNTPLAYAGRLDPMASGLLLVLIGEECKNQTNYHHLDKEYEFEILFGTHSDSGDVLGIVSEADKKIVTESEIKNILPEFIGDMEVPYPIFSSKTVQGKPLHTWTMENRLHEITIPTRKSEIFELELLNHKTLSRKEITEISLAKIETIPPVTDLRKALGNDFRRPDIRIAWANFSKTGSPADQFSIAKIRCLCSSGTYMRTLAEMIAEKLHSKGLAFSIHRTNFGYYKKETGFREM